MRCLVTGGAGFIGAHLSQRLIAMGHEVVVLDDFNETIYPVWLKQARCAQLLAPVPLLTIVTGSILDRLFLDTLFQKHRFTHVWHGAAHASANVRAEEEEAYTAVNLTGTLNVLQCATTYHVERFVLASSAAVYSDEQVPFRESTYPLHPLTVYGASKAAAEVYGRLWHERYQLPLISLRFFSVYGPWGRPDTAPMIFAHRLLTGQPILLTAEERWRDFTYVSDIVDGCLAALQCALPFGVFNLGSGQPVSLPDFIARLEKVTGLTATIALRPSPPGEMKRTYADIAQAHQALGYTPQVSLAKGLEQLVLWMRMWYMPTHQTHTASTAVNKANV